MRLVKGLAAAAVAAMALSACGGGSGGSSASGATHVVKHGMGEAKVSDAPKKIVVLDTDKLDTLATLGLTPVGATVPDQKAGMPKYLGPGFAKVKSVGTTQQPDVEAIAALKPDLILGSKFRMEKYYSQLSKIAPTVFTAQVGITWKQNFLLDAEAVGRKAEGEQKLKAYEDRARKVGASLGDPSKLKISVIRFMPDEIRQYGPDSFSGIVLHDAGLGRPDAQLLKDKSDKRFAPLSPERIDQADGDFVFVAAYGAKAATEQAKVTAGPLWQRLSAVKAGHTKPADDEIWMTGIGPTAANKLLDDLQSNLAPLAKK
ncbi:ABC transporter substrate-binding protein [Actinomadura rupiterrae]|uniref:ABC transporter substrate-binding protein n=1 Tax=Actinomadura rupiterrae TaxID=559627 RepID=UPI0020A553CC|nr:iron-siderophore ABC transporter substrate-binding protein [Actinomadura rupiterrae]MCP2338628.1 iron complex transport system substrate-binding protein [Actinomadura rupiterrae]